VLHDQQKLFSSVCQLTGDLSISGVIASTTFQTDFSNAFRASFGGVSTSKIPWLERRFNRDCGEADSDSTTTGTNNIGGDSVGMRAPPVFSEQQEQLIIRSSPSPTVSYVWYEPFPYGLLNLLLCSANASVNCGLD